MGTGEETARLAIDMDPSGLQSGAAAGAASLENLQDALEADKQAVKDLQESIRLLRGATSASAETIDEMKNRLAVAKNTMAGTAAQIIKAGGSMHKTKAETKGATSSIREMLGAASKAGGPLGELAGVGGRAAAAMGSVGVAGGIALAVAAMAALPAAVGAAVASLSKLAIGFADVRREQMIQLEGMTRIRHWWGYIPGSASDVQEAIDRVSDSTATGRDKIAQYAQELYRMGLRGANLESMLEATSMKFSIQGEEAADRFKGMAFGARMLGMSIKQMADTAKARLQDLNARQVIGFGVQMRKLKDSLPRLFDSVKIDGFLVSMRKVTSLFSLSTQTGKSLQAAIGSIFSTILGSSGSSGDVFRDLIRGMVLGLTNFAITLTDIEITWLKTKNSFKSLFPDEKSLFGMAITTSEIFENTLWGIVHASVGCALALGAVGAVLYYGIIKPFVFTSTVIWEAIKTVWSFATGVAKAVNMILSPLSLIGNLATSIGAAWRNSWKGGGSAIVQGIIDGIKADFGAAKNAITDLGGNLKGWFEQALGIHSPSRAFRVSAANIPRGAALGIQDEQDKPRLAVQNMVTSSDMDRAGKTGAAMRSGQTVRVDVGGISITTSADNFKDSAGDLRSQVAAIFEMAALQAGAL